MYLLLDFGLGEKNYALFAFDEGIKFGGIVDNLLNHNFGRITRKWRNDNKTVQMTKCWVLKK